MGSLDAPAHLFTMGANPVSCAAAVATLEMMEEDNLVEEAARKGEYAKTRMKAWEFPCFHTCFCIFAFSCCFLH